MPALAARAAASTAVVARRHSPAGTPVTRFLTHPSQIVHHLAHLLASALMHWGTAAALIAAGAAAVVIACRAWLRARQHAAFADGARVITVLALSCPAFSGQPLRSLRATPYRRENSRRYGP